MTKFWPASALADAPGMHPQLAYEIRMANKTAVLSSDALEAGYVVAVNDVVMPLELPVALPPCTDRAGQPVYLRLPTAWEFHKTERAGIIFLGESYIFIGCSLH